MSPHARRVLLATVAAAFAVGTPAVLGAEQSKVPSPLAAALKKELAPLCNGKISYDDTAEREKKTLDIEKVLEKQDKKDKAALKSPTFWVEAIQECRFASGGKNEPDTKSKGKVIEMPVTVTLKDGKESQTKLWLYSGKTTSASKPWPLLVTVLEKGMQPKSFLETSWIANEAVGKEWILAAMADGDDLPLVKEPGLIVQMLGNLIDRVNVDSNRWYLEGVGDACEPVQSVASSMLAQRVAGVVLRGPKKEVTTPNSSLFPTLVVYGAPSAEGKAVAEAYKKIDEKRNVPVELPDAAAVNALNDQVIAWCGEQRRTVPTSYTFVTTITETEGEPYTGTVIIRNPSKRGVPTKLAVKYARDSNSVEIQCENLSEFRLYMNDDLLNLDNDVTVVVNGKELVKRKFERQVREILEFISDWGDQGRVYTASYIAVVPTKVDAAAAGDKKPEEKKDGGAEPPK